VYQSHANGSFTQYPNGKHSISIYITGFVDDMSGSVNDFLVPTIHPPEHCLYLATQDSQLWNDIVLLSGGATKLSYHFLYYKFAVTGNPILVPRSSLSCHG
jgi:hypothetical protein